MVGQTKKIRASDALTASARAFSNLQSFSHGIAHCESFTDVLVSSIGGNVLPAFVCHRPCMWAIGAGLTLFGLKSYSIKKNLIEL
jgi:hypothetical protein